MRAILVLLRKDFAYFRRDRGSVILTFVVPFALIALFGQIFGVNRKSGDGPTAFPLAVVNQSASPEATKLIDALKAEQTFKIVETVASPGGGPDRPLAEADLRPMMRDDRFRFALVLPKNFAETDGFGVHVKLLSDPRNAIEAQTVDGLLQKVIYTQIPSLLGSQLRTRARDELGPEKLGQFDGKLADAISEAFGRDRDEVYRNLQAGQLGFDSTSLAPASGEGQSFLSRILKLDREQVAGKDVAKPMATQLVGGWAMQFLLFALVASATSLFHEKDHGIFQRILSGPVPRSAILWSKFLYGICLGLIQMAVLFTAGKVLFGIVIGPYLPKLVLVWICAAASCSAFGMVLAALAKTPEMARGLATFVILLMSAVGGAWFPVSFMPEFIQHFSKLTLVYWSVEGFLQVLWEHATLLELLPTLGILLAITAVFLSVAWWRFARGSIFD